MMFGVFVATPFGGGAIERCILYIIKKKERMSHLLVNYPSDEMKHYHLCHSIIVSEIFVSLVACHSCTTQMRSTFNDSHL